ncbi:MAG TPA: universal stress protein [Candidatus Dormibacteraeota bacterium]|nr:universal stress protein [Candidatus Dormibacteraeota bacterium]
MATRSSTMKRIVVGVDGSEPGKGAVEWTARLAKAMNSEVIAVYGLDLPIALPDPYAIPVYLDDKWRAGLQSELENKWCRPLKTAGVRYRAIVQDGRPASVILDVADQVKADLIALGRRGHGEVAELLLGSVSHEVVLHSKRPVFLVPQK